MCVPRFVFHLSCCDRKQLAGYGKSFGLGDGRCHFELRRGDVLFCRHGSTHLEDDLIVVTVDVNFVARTK